jgi:hypothetical protein
MHAVVMEQKKHNTKRITIGWNAYGAFFSGDHPSLFNTHNVKHLCTKIISLNS